MPVPESFRSVLQTPFAYLTYQFLVGGIRARRICLRDYAPVRAGMVVLDIGCGPGYTAKWLPGAVYYGFDISPSYIAYARRRFGPQATFRCELFTPAVASQIPPADLVLLMGLLHHLDDQESLSLLCLVKNAMRPGGRLITLDGCYRTGQSRAARYLLDSDRGKYIRSAGAYEEIAKQVFPEVKAAVREDLFWVPYTCLVLTCRT